MFVHPSRADAWDMTRNEKISLMFLMNTVSALQEAKKDLAARLTQIEHGEERMAALAKESMDLLTEIRQTVPERQRNSLANTATDYEMRLLPKMTPRKTSVVVEKEDFRQLVDAAQTQCRECTEDNEACRQCKLYQLLTVVLPLDRYDGTFLCPYNMAEWSN